MESTMSEKMKTTARTTAKTRAEGENGIEGEKGEGEWEDVEEEKEGEGKRKQQKVFVLKGGFVEWQEVFGEDARLTEGYVKDIWKDGY